MPNPFDPTPSTPPTRSGGDEFWGDQAGWSHAAGRRRPPRVSSGSTARRWWGSVIGGGTTATRTHGVSVRPNSTDDIDVAPLPLPPDLAEAPTDDDREAGTDGGWDDGWDVEPTPPRRPGVDPLLARFGLLAVVVTLCVPVVMGFTSGDDNDQIRDVATAADAVSDETAAGSTATVTPSSVGTLTSSEAGQALPTGALAAATSTVTDLPESTVAVAAAPQPDASPCGAAYDLRSGDYWIRIADAADVRLADLLAVNDATIDSVLVPGRSICLPVGASTPAPPPTQASTSSSSSSSSTSSSTSTSARPAPAITTPPTTPPPTAAPATTSPPRPPATAAEVEAIIRSVWPDELEQHALEIAWRESKYQSTARNSCCYGLFQIHWVAHQSWLRGIGITSADQLLDPTTNARAAYALYQRSGGFGPWGG